jgi:hypothetical protein
MKTTRLFRNLWRVNAVIIFAAGVLALLVGGIAAYYMLKEMTRERAVDSVVNTETDQHIEQSIILGTAREIGGHPWLLVPLESDQHYDMGSFSKEASAARNYVFVSRSLEMRWLYPHSRFLIVTTTTSRMQRRSFHSRSCSRTRIAISGSLLRIHPAWCSLSRTAVASPRFWGTSAKSCLRN